MSTTRSQDFADPSGRDLNSDLSAHGHLIADGNIKQLSSWSLKLGSGRFRSKHNGLEPSTPYLLNCSFSDERNNPKCRRLRLHKQRKRPEGRSNAGEAATYPFVVSTLEQDLMDLS